MFATTQKITENKIIAFPQRPTPKDNASLTAVWTVENNHLVCKWINASQHAQ